MMYLYLKKTIAGVLMLSIILCGMSSCQKDKGNYIYHDINEVVIKGMDSLYAINEGEALKINPVVTFTEDASPDTSKYKYEWFQGIEVGFTGVAPTLITNKPDIDTVLDLDLGTYQMYFRVTDKKTGIYKTQPFLLSIVNKAYMGWLMLSDVNGAARLDMVSTYRDENKLYRNILDTMQSDVKLTGSPVSVGFLRNNSMGGLFFNFIVTSDQGWVTERDALKNKPLYSFDKTVPGNPGNYTGARLDYAIFLVTMHNQGNIYINDYSSSFGNFVNNKEVKPDPNSPAVSERFEAASYFAMDPASKVMILFNTAEKSFYRYPGNGNLCFPFELPGVKQGNIDLIYLNYTNYNSGEAFAVLRDLATQKLFLLRFTTTGKVNYYAEMNGPGLAAAQHFAISPVFGYVFYASGSKVYEYDFARKEAIEMLDLKGETINKLGFHRFQQINAAITPYADLYTEIQKNLIVCSYKPDAPATSGKFSIYDVPAINKPLALKQSFEGFGKIVSFTYRER